MKLRCDSAYCDVAVLFFVAVQWNIWYLNILEAIMCMTYLCYSVILYVTKERVREIVVQKRNVRWRHFVSASLCLRSPSQNHGMSGPCPLAWTNTTLRKLVLFASSGEWREEHGNPPLRNPREHMSPSPHVQTKTQSSFRKVAFSSYFEFRTIEKVR